MQSWLRDFPLILGALVLVAAGCSRDSADTNSRLASFCINQLAANQHQTKRISDLLGELPQRPTSFAVAKGTSGSGLYYFLLLDYGTEMTAVYYRSFFELRQQSIPRELGTRLLTNLSESIEESPVIDEGMATFHGRCDFVRTNIDGEILEGMYRDALLGDTSTPVWVALGEVVDWIDRQYGAEVPNAIHEEGPIDQSDAELESVVRMLVDDIFVELPDSWVH